MHATLVRGDVKSVSSLTKLIGFSSSLTEPAKCKWFCGNKLISCKNENKMPFDLCINADAIIVKKRSFDLYCYCCFFYFSCIIQISYTE